uniref:Uncharacterized protein n=1 Tax=Oryzias sinensis TaxID=183150 RepID=A0A8C7XMH9_9TELE
MGCTSAKQMSAVSNGEEGKNKAYSNGDVLSDEYKMKGAEEVKCTAEEQEEAVADGHGGTEKSALLDKGQCTEESGSNGKVLYVRLSCDALSVMLLHIVVLACSASVFLPGASIPLRVSRSSSGCWTRRLKR